MTSKKSPSILRAAHGAAATLGALLVSETPPLDEVPPPNAEDTERGLALAKKRGRPFQADNTAGANRKPALALLGVEIDAADPRYRKALRKASSYRQRRIRELAMQHGGTLGAGPSAMLASSALALAASRMLYELAGESLDAELFVRAAKLADSARAQELTAVALAEREAASRPRANAIDAVRARIMGPKEGT
jgi:hypothetical protein